MAAAVARYRDHTFRFLANPKKFSEHVFPTVDTSIGMSHQEQQLLSGGVSEYVPPPQDPGFSDWSEENRSKYSADMMNYNPNRPVEYWADSDPSYCRNGDSCEVCYLYGYGSCNQVDLYGNALPEGYTSYSTGGSSYGCYSTPDIDGVASSATAGGDSSSSSSSSYATTADSTDSHYSGSTDMTSYSGGGSYTDDAAYDPYGSDTSHLYGDNGYDSQQYYSTAQPAVQTVQSSYGHQPQYSGYASQPDYSTVMTLSTPPMQPSRPMSSVLVSYAQPSSGYRPTAAAPSTTTTTTTSSSTMSLPQPPVSRPTSTMMYQPSSSSSSMPPLPSAGPSYMTALPQPPSSRALIASVTSKGFYSSTKKSLESSGLISSSNSSPSSGTAGTLGVTSTALTVPQGIPIDDGRPWTDKDYTALRKAQNYWKIGWPIKKFEIGCDRVELYFELFKVEKDESKNHWVSKEINKRLIAATAIEAAISAIPFIPVEVPVRDIAEKFLTRNIMHFERKFDELGPNVTAERGLNYKALGLEILAQVKPKKKDTVSGGVFRIGGSGGSSGVGDAGKGKKKNLIDHLGAVLGAFTGIKIGGGGDEGSLGQQTPPPLAEQPVYAVSGATGVSSSSPNVVYGGSSSLLASMSQPLTPLDFGGTSTKSPSVATATVAAVSANTASETRRQVQSLDSIPPPDDDDESPLDKSFGTVSNVE
jgi:hypothetical protein